MRTVMVVMGSLIALGGLVLLLTHGTVLGTNVPNLLGLPCEGGNSSSFCPGFGGYSIGTIVLLAGGSMFMSGLMAPSSPHFGPTGPMPYPMTAEAMNALMRPPAGTPVAAPAALGASSAPGETPGARYCPACGQRNDATAAFCNRCGKAMPKVE